jgi:predicted acetyltransferase
MVPYSTKMGLGPFFFPDYGFSFYIYRLDKNVVGFIPLRSLNILKKSFP